MEPLRRHGGRRLAEAPGLDAVDAEPLIVPQQRCDSIAVLRRVQFEDAVAVGVVHVDRSEEHASELQSLMRISYAVFCLKKKKKIQLITQQLCKNTEYTRQ